MRVCDEPAFGLNEGESRSWDCTDEESFGRKTPALSADRRCFLDGKLHAGTNFQFEGGSVEEGTLTFPPGSGFPVDAAKKKSVLFFVHYPKKRDGLIQGSSLEVSLKRSQTVVKTAGTIELSAVGFIGPQSVGTISGSWRLQEMPIQILRLYTHWHDLAIDVMVGVKKANGEEHMMLHQDPHAFKGITNISASEFAILNPGDRLTFNCTYNNTDAGALRVM